MTTRFENSSSSTISDLIAPDGIISGSETSSEATSFPQNHTKTQKPPVLIKEYPETLKAPTSGPLNWADDTNTLPISTTLPQHAPRDLSCLRSTSACPFLSLRRRRGRPKNHWNAQCLGYHSHLYPFKFPAWNHPPPHTPFRVPISLDWDCDPRLADLSNALRALGWSRQ